MSVYVDSLRPCVPNRRWRWPESCHLYADTLGELHEFAVAIGLKRAWFQNKEKLPHYDLNAARREAAVRAGAVEHTSREMVEFMRRRRDDTGRGEKS